MFWKPVLFCGALFFPAFLLGQGTAVLETDSLIEGGDYTRVVVEAKGKVGLETNSENWNTRALEVYGVGTVAAVLERESGVFIKSYGNGSLATTSLRGGSAGQTVVVWNGFALQSPMLGQLDFSLLPTAFVDEMTVEYGGNSSLWGGGAIGGVVHLKNNSPKQKGISASILSEIGSFGLWNEDLQFQFKTDKFSGKTSFFHKQAKNNFTYQIREDLPKVEQKNAAIKANGLLQELYWQINLQHQLSLFAWLQESDRQIPPTTVQNESLASQEDDFLRTGIHYKWIGEKMSVKARTAFFKEKLDYRDDKILLVSESQYDIWTTELEGERAFGKQRLLLGLHNTIAQADIKNYAEPPTESRSALYALLAGEIVGKLQYQISVRQQLVDKKAVSPTASLALEGNPIKGVFLTAKATRNYRLPTFNDRYWRPGGDLDLQPESGWSEELTFRFEKEIKQRHLFKYSITAFNRNIDNWILWSVNEGENFYSANNITKVWSRGLENRLSYIQSIKKTTISLSVAYDHIRSTNEVKVIFPKMEVGDQLIYTPVHQAYGSIGFTWKDLSASYKHRFTGKVYGQNVAELDGYQVAYFNANYAINHKHFQGKLFFQLDNIWNASYRVIERRPMPGRSFRLGIRIGVEAFQ